MAPELFSFNKRTLILLFCLIFPGTFLPVAVKAQWEVSIRIPVRRGRAVGTL